MITHEIHAERELTVHTCRGIITGQDLISAIQALYDSVSIPHHLWDLTEADISHVAGQGVHKIAEFPTRYVPARIGARRVSGVLGSCLLHARAARQRRVCVEVRHAEKIASQPQAFRTNRKKRSTGS
jgi:acyl CoA:acetate/3-ketoacid CoA transferase